MESAALNKSLGDIKFEIENMISNTKVDQATH
jgi:hypothetical protein